jgi:hypothetical protein
MIIYTLIIYILYIYSNMLVSPSDCWRIRVLRNKSIIWNIRKTHHYVSTILLLQKSHTVQRDPKMTMSCRQEGNWKEAVALLTLIDRRKLPKTIMISTVVFWTLQMEERRWEPRVSVYGVKPRKPEPMSWRRELIIFNIIRRTRNSAEIRSGNFLPTSLQRLLTLR